MIKKCNVYIVCLGAFLFSGCGNELLQPETDGERTPIAFKATDTSVSMGEQTRATNDAFPHSGSIAIVAVNANSTTPDWSDIHMNHIAATAATETDAKHSVAIDGGAVYYWPFHSDRYLSFAAYSPRAGESGMLSIVDSDKSKLRVAPTSPTYTYPDLLCTAPVGPHNKACSEVELPFGHVMAQVEINVIAIDDAGEEIANPNPSIIITSLTLGSKIAGGTFDLAQNEWSLDSPADEDFSTFSTLISSDTKLPPKKMSCLLLPGTEKNIKVSISLKDASGATVSQSATINEFTTGSTPASLEKSKRTVLTIKVNPRDVSISLQGDLEPWDYKGDSEVTIE